MTEGLTSVGLTFVHLQRKVSLTGHYGVVTKVQCSHWFTRSANMD